MNFSRFLSFGLALLLLSATLPAQQSTTIDAQAKTLLQHSFAALSGSTSISDVTLSGSARRIAGSDDESGTAVLKALATGESRIDLVFPSGVRTEVRAFPASGPSGSWVGPDGITHVISQHNLWTDSSWFFPVFTLSRLLSDSAYILSYVGHETRNGQAVEHLTTYRQFQAVGAPPGWHPTPLQRLTAMDIYLDSVTLLPSAILLNTHPDRNQALDIPVEIRFSSYQQTSGLTLPLHIQQHFNNALALDIQINNVSLNTGLSTSAFTVQ